MKYLFTPSVKIANLHIFFALAKAENICKYEKPDSKGSYALKSWDDVWDEDESALKTIKLAWRQPFHYSCDECHRSVPLATFLTPPSKMCCVCVHIHKILLIFHNSFPTIAPLCYWVIICNSVHLIQIPPVWPAVFKKGFCFIFLKFTDKNLKQRVSYISTWS